MLSGTNSYEGGTRWRPARCRSRPTPISAPLRAGSRSPAARWRRQSVSRGRAT
ncbi:hypothetical protein [Ancylobacter koreensis]|uniref:hypothetical protein n=1 Tax=Ancylobacter koreensis TaxID=266121 RepID=UPI003CCFF056